MGFIDMMAWMEASDASSSAREASDTASNTQKQVMILEESQKAEMKLLFAICKKLKLNPEEIISE